MNKKSIQYLKQIKILYVEDNKDIKEEIEFFLSNKVKELYVAENGQEGLDLYEQHKPDLIVTDIQMPIMNGIDMISQIRDENDNIPIIIATAFNDAEYLQKAIGLNVNHYLTKPINLFSLVELLIKFSKEINLKNENNELLNILEQYKNIIDESSSISKIDKDGILIYTNDLFCELLSCNKEDIIGKRYSLLETKYDDEYDKVYSHKKYIGKVSNIINGKKLDFNIQIFPITNKNNEVIEYLEIRDILKDSE